MFVFSSTRNFLFQRRLTSQLNWKKNRREWWQQWNERTINGTSKTPSVVLRLYKRSEEKRRRCHVTTSFVSAMKATVKDGRSRTQLALSTSHCYQHNLHFTIVAGFINFFKPTLFVRWKQVCRSSRPAPSTHFMPMMPSWRRDERTFAMVQAHTRMPRVQRIHKRDTRLSSSGNQRTRAESSAVVHCLYREQRIVIVCCWANENGFIAFFFEFEFFFFGCLFTASWRKPFFCLPMW